MTSVTRQTEAEPQSHGGETWVDGDLSDFATAAMWLPRLRDAFSAKLCAGPAPADALRFDAPEVGPLDAWLAAEIEGQARADDKLAAAYLLGRVAFAVAEVLAALALRGTQPARLTPEAVALIARRALWHLDGDSGEGRAYDVVLYDPALASCGAPAAALGSAVPALLSPLVQCLLRRSGLSRGALWRLVGDALAGALLMQGKHAGREEESMAIALLVLRDRHSPLCSRQTDFFRIELPERPDIAEWFRARGGCCRYYTTEGGEYCSTCVLRDAESREVLLRDHLRRKHGLKAT